MTKPVVIILEDSPERVEWFRVEFPDVECVWCESVDDFFDKLRLVPREDLRLILLDHDLGDVKASRPDRRVAAGETFEDAVLHAGIISGGSWPMDRDGKNGMHAVDGLDPWRDVPTIVWSINSIAAPKMVENLTRKGFVAAWIPFRGDLRWRLRAAISSQVE